VGVVAARHALAVAEVRDRVAVGVDRVVAALAHVVLVAHAVAVVVGALDRDVTHGVLLPVARDITGHVHRSVGTGVRMESTGFTTGRDQTGHEQDHELLATRCHRFSFQ